MTTPMLPDSGRTTTEMRESRTMVLCFDGTTNQYSAKNTNVVQFFSLLKKDDFNEQQCYYQAGVGTGFAPGVVSPLFEWIATVADMGLAWYLDQHVMDGYKFLMNNYRVGDKICLFGFSRGAYTARALAGMLYKVGLLPRDNEEQIPFAYRLYKRTDKQGIKLAPGFKRTYCQEVSIEFLGVWDTVASVGLVAGRNLPFTSSASNIKTFRHALALDEHRVKFLPNYYHRTAPNDKAAEKDPEHSSPIIGRDDSSSEQGSKKRKAAVFHEADNSRAATDVLEVWFAGCHSDVGGGELANTNTSEPPCLSNITLRWMVRQVIQAQCGIMFDQAALDAMDITSPVEAAFSNLRLKRKHGAGQQSVLAVDPLEGEREKDHVDAVQPIHDSLKIHPIWWVLEVIPWAYHWQDIKGYWHKSFGINFGRGRDLTKTIQEIKVHESVKVRMDDPKLKYKPKAKFDPKCVEYVF